MNESKISPIYCESKNSPHPKSLCYGERLAHKAESKLSPLHCESDSTKSPLPCGGGLGVGIKTQNIKTSKFGKDFTHPLAPSAREGEQENNNFARGWEYVGLLRTSGGEVEYSNSARDKKQRVSHRQLAPYMKDFSRAMRKNPTQAENKLWQELRGKKLGFGFRRQFVIDSKYIADFVCLEKRLIIECDGGGHSKSPCESDFSKSPLPCGGDLGVGKDTLNHPDIQRDFYLESQNFRILRFWNNEILGNLEGVLCVIKEALESNADFANMKFTCESTHPLAPSAGEGEQESNPRAKNKINKESK